MKTNTIKVLKVEPHKTPEPVMLKNDLDSLQKAVSIGADSQGLIEIISIEPHVCLLCNEEAKLIGLEGNRHFGDDIIAGVFYVTGDRNGQLDSLPDAYMEKYTKLLYEPEDISTEEVEESIRFELCFIDDNKDGDNE